jgi:seryl-tRNA synthetase
MERFRSKQTIEDRARELDAEKKKQWDQQLQAEREAAGEELQALLKRQEAAAAKVEAQRAASALRVGPKKSRLTAAERRIAKLRSKYPSVIDEADLLFGKPE